MIINPLESAFNYFLGFMYILPSPIRLFIYLTFGLFVVSTLVHMIFR